MSEGSWECEKIQALVNRVGFSGLLGPWLILAGIKGAVSDGSSFIVSCLSM